jgi:hypothetical protein
MYFTIMNTNQWFYQLNLISLIATAVNFLFFILLLTTAIDVSLFLMISLGSISLMGGITGVFWGKTKFIKYCSAINIAVAVSMLATTFYIAYAVIKIFNSFAALIGLI